MKATATALNLTKTYKKAIVSLSEGDTIDFYSNI